MPTFTPGRNKSAKDERNHAVGSLVNLRRQKLVQLPIQHTQNLRPATAGANENSHNQSEENKRHEPAIAFIPSSCDTIQRMIDSENNSVNSRHETLNEFPKKSTNHKKLKHDIQNGKRCTGCGSIADLCMFCFSKFKAQDLIEYKTTLSRSVETLFITATSRASSIMSSVTLQWLFGSWKYHTKVTKQRRKLANKVLHRKRLLYVWKQWHTFVFHRRTLGAMLLAESEVRQTESHVKVIDKLTGDICDMKANIKSTETCYSNSIQEMNTEIKRLQNLLEIKNAYFVTLQSELIETQNTLKNMKEVFVDPKQVDQLRIDVQDTKTLVYSCVEAICQSMETQISNLMTGEEHQGIKQIFTKDLIQAVGRPERASFVDPNSTSILERKSSGLSTAVAIQRTAGNIISQEASADRADRIIMQWVNAVLQEQKQDWVVADGMVNYDSSLTDGKVYISLTRILHDKMMTLNQPESVLQRQSSSSSLELARKTRNEGSILSDFAMGRYLEQIEKVDDIGKRLEIVIKTMGNALWLPIGLLTAKDIMAGHADFNFVALSYLFITSMPNLDDQLAVQYKELSSQLDLLRVEWKNFRQESDSEKNANSFDNNIANASDIMKLRLALSHTIALKKKVDIEVQSARDANILWWKCARIVMRKSFLTYGKLSRGLPGLFSNNSEQVDDNAAFREAPISSIQDIALVTEDFAWEQSLVQTTIASISCELAYIYKSLIGKREVKKVSGYVTVGDFIACLTEFGVIGKGALSISAVEDILMRVDQKFTNSNPHRPLSPGKFIEAIIRLARKRYSDDIPRKTLSTALNLFVDTYILPNIFHDEAEVFRKQLLEPKVRRVFLKYSNEIEKNYRQYSTHDPIDYDKSSMTSDGFCQCLMDKKVLDFSLTSQKVRTIFQQSTKLLAMSDEKVTIGIFENTIAVIACYKLPDPYLPLETRIQKFFDSYFLEQDNKE